MNTLHILHDDSNGPSDPRLAVAIANEIRLIGLGAASAGDSAPEGASLQALLARLFADVPSLSASTVTVRLTGALLRADAEAIWSRVQMRSGWWDAADGYE
ncbi:hypothetical protein G3576_15315 [Roseomonas stagni]|uniref:Uncharacterized protein n=1 Tax=Falsiroseomonas algicola TaxID=2716930 RepID=A0A6M1LMV5_9PROT|nr:hypothetical protein [Falsiroseomonas algicola]NGM21392.1 hypothetical protein [Falsiroseomonas algicola]